MKCPHCKANFGVDAEKVVLPITCPACEKTITGQEGVEDRINHPKHYQSSFGVECIEVIEGLGLPYHLGNTLKYMWRAGKKHDRRLEDLKKAKWYLDRYIEYLEKGGT